MVGEMCNMSRVIIIRGQPVTLFETGSVTPIKGAPGLELEFKIFKKNKTPVIHCLKQVIGGRRNTIIGPKKNTRRV